MKLVIPGLSEATSPEPILAEGRLVRRAPRNDAALYLFSAGCPPRFHSFSVALFARLSPLAVTFVSFSGERIMSRLVRKPQLPDLDLQIAVSRGVLHSGLAGMQMAGAVPGDNYLERMVKYIPARDHRLLDADQCHP